VVARRDHGQGGQSGPDPKATAIAAAVNGVVFALALAVFWLLFPPPAPPEALGLTARLELAARLAVWPALLMLAMVVAVAVSRVETAAFDPLRDRHGRFYQVNQRVLANTVEQSAIFLPAMAAGAILFDAARLAGLPLAAWFFAVGRLAFWAGYLAHPYARSPGMVVTGTANLALIAGLLAAILR
jgi:hypothetical protein